MDDQVEPERGNRETPSFLNFNVITLCRSGNGGFESQNALIARSHHRAVLANRMRHHKFCNCATILRTTLMFSALSGER